MKLKGKQNAWFRSAELRCDAHLNEHICHNLMDVHHYLASENPNTHVASLHPIHQVIYMHTHILGKNLRHQHTKSNVFIYRTQNI